MVVAILDPTAATAIEATKEDPLTRVSFHYLHEVVQAVPSTGLLPSTGQDSLPQEPVEIEPAAKREPQWYHEPLQEDDEDEDS